MFKKTPEDLDAKARDAAAKRNIDVTGALAVLHDLQDDAEDAYLVVFPDRVERVSRGKRGSLLRPGAGVESIPTGNIASVNARNSGVFCELSVHGSGNSIDFRTNQISGPWARTVIMGAMTAGRAPAPAAAPADQVDHAGSLGKLAELHAQGVLTDDEFAAKKAEILARM